MAQKNLLCRIFGHRMAFAGWWYEQISLCEVGEVGSIYQCLRCSYTERRHKKEED